MTSIAGAIKAPPATYIYRGIANKHSHEERRGRGRDAEL